MGLGDESLRPQGLEVLVVLLCLGTLAGILIPLAVQNVKQERLSQAGVEIREIHAALERFVREVGQEPTRSDGLVGGALHVLYSSADGQTPEIPPGAYMPGRPEQRDPLADHLIHNEQEYPAWNGRVGWNGPYLEWDHLDPWGHSYLVYVIGFWHAWDDPQTDFTEVWILSAGPDGILQTFASDPVIALDSDDVGLRVR